MTRYALLIGCDEYTNFPETDFGCADMNLIMETLGEYCDYESKNIMTEPLYKNCDILPDDIYNKLLNMIKKLEEEDSLLFYFAGHGVKEENEGYLILSDTKLSDIQNTALSLSKINNILKDTKRNCFIILDACHSGIRTRGGLPPLDTSVISDTGCVIFASCSENEESHPYLEQEQGVFTYYLCEEIKKNPIGEPIYIEKLKMKVCEDVAKWAKDNFKKQTPTLNGQIVGNVNIAYRNEKKYEQKNESKVRSTVSREDILKNASKFLLELAEKAGDIVNTSGNSKKFELSSEIQGIQTDTLYKTAVKDWLNNNTKLKISDMVPENSEWRVFGQHYVYLAHDDRGEAWLVMLNILKKYNYSSVIHAFNNLQEIRNYYLKFGKNYNCYQLVLIPEGTDNVKQLNKTIATHPKLKKLYNTSKVMNTVVFLKNGKFNYISSNYESKND